jgi:hypothetical protein
MPLSKPISATISESRLPRRQMRAPNSGALLSPNLKFYNQVSNFPPTNSLQRVLPPRDTQPFDR